MKDEDAVINMVDSNLQRELIRPSEKAFAYKMKYEAVRKKGSQNARGQTDHKFPGGRTIDIIGEESGESPKQVQRYLKITELTPEEMQSILSEVKKGEVDRVVFKNEQLYQYFPKDYTSERMKREILHLLKQRQGLNREAKQREDF